MICHVITEYHRASRAHFFALPLAVSVVTMTRGRQARKLEKLRQGGVEYVIINFGGSREQIRRFARDIMPAFADQPALALAGQ